MVVMDGDLQDPPEVIPRMMRLHAEGFDVVYAVRRRRKEHIIKRFAYWSFYRILMRIGDVDVPPDSGDFCLMGREVIDALKGTAGAGAVRPRVADVRRVPAGRA